MIEGWILTATRKLFKACSISIKNFWQDCFFSDLLAVNRRLINNELVREDVK
jgi:hypothetical protein